jgi:hypothetical protein
MPRPSSEGNSLHVFPYAILAGYITQISVHAREVIRKRCQDRIHIFIERAHDADIPEVAVIIHVEKITKWPLNSNRGGFSMSQRLRKRLPSSCIHPVPAVGMLWASARPDLGLAVTSFAHDNGDDEALVRIS